MSKFKPAALAAARENAGLTIRQASQQAGVRWHTISDAEKGRSQPNLATLSALANTYDVHWTSFFEDPVEVA